MILLCVSCLILPLTDLKIKDKQKKNGGSGYLRGMSKFTEPVSESWDSDQAVCQQGPGAHRSHGLGSRTVSRSKCQLLETVTRP